MIVDEGKYYLYRHIRLDNKQPFYIGIGTKSTTKGLHKTIYQRAYSRFDRNKYWKNIVKKFGYGVQIILESDSLEFIKTKEIEFIELYGTIYENTGILCNMTKGGDYPSFTLNLKEMSKKAHRARCNDIYKYNTNGDLLEIVNFGKEKYQQEYSKKEKTMINNGLHNNYRTVLNFVWSTTPLTKIDIRNKLSENLRHSNSYCPYFYNVLDNGVNNKFETLKEIGKYYNMDTTSVTNYIKGKVKTSKLNGIIITKVTK